jgi:spore coat polysaccharide biosynthesis predicted glycosyltransferase SpsG
MRILLRADAGPVTGTGHVMRCLTLAEVLRARGHEALLAGDLGGIGWLQEAVAAAAIEVRDTAPGTLDVDALTASGADRVVVDSYDIAADRITELDDRLPVLAVIDGDDRGIRATWYLDQNLGAEDVPRPAGVSARLLAGSRYSLVRRAIVDLRREDGATATPPRILVMMGGTDATEVATDVAATLAGAGLTRITAIGRTPSPGVDVVPPTPDLPALIGASDVVISAAGTSAWDVCTTGRAAVLLALVPNQQESLRRALDADVAVGLDLVTDPGAIAGLGDLVAGMLADDAGRRRRIQSALRLFDGRGAERVADVLEA